jgi:hypothetical protein
VSERLEWGLCQDVPICAKSASPKKQIENVPSVAVENQKNKGDFAGRVGSASWVKQMGSGIITIRVGLCAVTWPEHILMPTPPFNAFWTGCLA